MAQNCQNRMINWLFSRQRHERLSRKSSIYTLALPGWVTYFQKPNMTKLDRFLTALLVIAIGVMSGLFLQYWQYGFSSDYAMIGLMAKHILERGEHPIFVWSVGYQGMFLEGHAVALAFKLFGISPVTLNYAPFVFYLLTILFFFLCVQESFGRTVGLLSAFFVVVSTPEFYGRVLRTQPNYGETYMFGLMLIYVYLRFLAGFSKKGKIRTRDLP